MAVFSAIHTRRPSPPLLSMLTAIAIKIPYTAYTTCEWFLCFVFFGDVIQTGSKFEEITNVLLKTF